MLASCSHKSTAHVVDDSSKDTLPLRVQCCEVHQMGEALLY